MILTQRNKNEFKQWHDSAQTEGAFALVDKDLDWTSFDVIAKLRGMLRIKKVGHAGTLDPLATGLLILGFGKGTKGIENFLNMKKKYNSTVRLGATTKSDDSEFDEENIKSIDNINTEMITEAVKSFEGKIEQVPPMFSAKKVSGKKLYQLARKNIEIDLKPSSVEIYKIDILEINLPYINIDVECAKGVYIRALARDIGAKLGCGAYLSALRRTEIGENQVQDALRVSDFAELVSINPLSNNKENE